MIDIFSTFRGKTKQISENDKRSVNIKHCVDGSVELDIYHSWGPENRKTITVHIPPQHLREVRDKCNRGLQTITGHKYTTTVNVNP